ncbi:hypothetical protein ACFPZ0_21985 [Streptomonospora nanhaiensis]|uniref:Membrane protein implicated in regulation of membrane protease activity n=1 Tax=Streptomonospora nanhaiensis TaxID=1323731 RepID=A0A853BN07_9ACTN|nr:hypothetical protein [Streptomonospora nanhaiensis]MBX9389975.1 hypothetical protein [Streptomonospora nanhaiensis]NYI95986.1 membrane protein implicated in regulation of membrane protease activity [Streptomonospora nanhaiensis]
MAPSSDKPVREPIRKPWIWIVLALLLLAGVPLYWPPGTVEPIVLGLPLWALVTVGSSVVLSAYLSWLCLTQWSMVEEQEEREERERRAERGGHGEGGA